MADDAFTIPIEGDAAPFREALRGLRVAMAELTAAMRKQAQDAQAGQAKMATGWGRVVKRAGQVGDAVGGIASGIGLALQLSNKLGRARMAGGVAEAAAGGMNLRKSLGAVWGQMRRVMRTRTFKVVAAGALGAAAAVVTVRTGLRVMRSAGRAAGRALRASFAAARRTAAGLGSTVRGIFRGIGGGLGGLVPGGMLPVAGVLGLAGAMTVLGNETRKAMSAGEEFEALRVRVEQFTGSAEAAKALFEELDRFEVRTPFEGAAIRGAGLRLLESGVRDDVAGLVKDLGALAKSGDVLRDLGDAMGRGFTKGKFQTDDLNKFLDRGINLRPELMKVLGTDAAGLDQALQTGLSFDEVRRGIRGMSREGGQFFGLLDRMSVTTRGLWSTLASGIEVVRRKFGTPINDALKPILQGAIGMVGRLATMAEKAGAAVGDVMLTAFAAFQSGRLGELVSKSLKVGMLGAVDVLLRGVRGATAFLATALPDIFGGAVDMLTDQRVRTAMLRTFTGMGAAMAAVMTEALPSWMVDKEKGPMLQTQSKNDLNQAANLVQQIIDDQPTGASRVAGAVAAGAKAAAAAAKGAPASEALKRNQTELKELMREFGAVVEDLKKKSAVPPAPARPEATPGVAGGPAAPSMVQRTLQTISTSMARVGGGGYGVTLFEPMLSESQRQTRILNRIEKNTKRRPGGNKGPAVYA